MKITMSMDVFRWPEWKAFSERLGIVEASTRALTIHLEVGEPVIVTQEYFPKTPEGAEKK